MSRQLLQVAARSMRAQLSSRSLHPLPSVAHRSFSILSKREKELKDLGFVRMTVGACDFMFVYLFPLCLF